MTNVKNQNTLQETLHFIFGDADSAGTGNKPQQFELYGPNGGQLYTIANAKRMIDTEKTVIDTFVGNEIMLNGEHGWKLYTKNIVYREKPLMASYDVTVTTSCVISLIAADEDDARNQVQNDPLIRRQIQDLLMRNGLDITDLQKSE